MPQGKRIGDDLQERVVSMRAQGRSVAAIGELTRRTRRRTVVKATLRWYGPRPAAGC